MRVSMAKRSPLEGGRAMRSRTCATLGAALRAEAVIATRVPASDECVTAS